MKTKIFIGYILALLILSFGFQGCNKDSSSAAGGPGIGQGGSTARFTIVGNYLYVVDNRSLKSYDISNPANTVFKSRVDIGFNIETIFPFQNRLFIGSSTTMYIYSLANPEQPSKLSSATYPSVNWGCDPVVARDSVAWATLNSFGPCGQSSSALLVFNIKDVNNPKQVNNISMLQPIGLGYKDSALYVCEQLSGLRVFNIRNAYSPVQVATVPASGNTDRFVDVIPYGNTLIAQVNGGTNLYDITNVLQPSLLSKIRN